MRLSEKEIAEIICGGQDTCIHRKPDGSHGGFCGDCCIPAHAIFALENGLPVDMDRIDGNHAAQRIAARS